jgi:hypothetical protein
MMASHEMITTKFFATGESPRRGFADLSNSNTTKICNEEDCNSSIPLPYLYPNSLEARGALAALNLLINWGRSF